MRKTVVYYEDGTQDVIQDNFKQSSHPGRLLPKKWKGHTTFEIKVQSHEKQGESARQVVMHQNEHPPFLDPNVIENFEAQVLGARSQLLKLTPVTALEGAVLTRSQLH